MPLPVPVLVTVRGKTFRVNVAVTDFAVSIVITQGPVPPHAPLQPVKFDVASGLAVSVTSVPKSNDATHNRPQSMPAGVLVTAPPPVPARVTVSVCVTRVNVAVTALGASIVMTHAPVPVHAPLQPANVEFASGLAVRVTVVPEPNKAVHAAPQNIPPGVLVTVPPPVPAFVTVRATGGGGESSSTTIVLAVVPT